MSDKDRLPLGRAGLTLPEITRKKEKIQEKKLQENIAALLRIRDIEFNVSRMDRKKTDKTGWPDFTFAIDGLACAVEVKRPGEIPTDEQFKVMGRLQRNGWFVRVVFSESDFLQFLQDAAERLKSR
jgi:hypothetical protein